MTTQDRHFIQSQVFFLASLIVEPTAMKVTAFLAYILFGVSAIWPKRPASDGSGREGV